MVLHHDHVAGEQLFIDYAGDTVTVWEPSGSWQAQIFVAVLGMSVYTYAKACRSQALESFLQAHVSALHFFGGVPRIFVPDNLRAAVSTADRYEPTVNRSYAELARHYGAAVLPARPRKPRDKAAVEAAVLGVERELLTPLLRQQRRFSSLAELNEALREGLEAYNAKPFQKREGSRRSVFVSVEQPALLALPERDYEFAVWLTARVNVDHHVTVRKWHYSAPASLLRQQVDVRLSAHSVELFCACGEGAKVTDDGIDGVAGAREAAGHLGGREIFDEEGAEDFVATLARMGGLVEEGAQIGAAGRRGLVAHIRYYITHGDTYNNYQNTDLRHGATP